MLDIQYLKLMCYVTCGSGFGLCHRSGLCFLVSVSGLGPRPESRDQRLSVSVTGLGPARTPVSVTDLGLAGIGRDLLQLYRIRSESGGIRSVSVQD